MSKDKVIGAVLLVVSIAGILAYGWVIFFTEWWRIALQLTAFIAVGVVLAILAWIGYTIATTPSPRPIEEIEKEIERELSKLDASES
ncbi:MAG: transcriptional regulator [Nitrososphaerota archaeon]